MRPKNSHVTLLVPIMREWGESVTIPSIPQNALKMWPRPTFSYMRFLMSLFTLTIWPRCSTKRRHRLQGGFLTILAQLYPAKQATVCLSVPTRIWFGSVGTTPAWVWKMTREKKCLLFTKDRLTARKCASFYFFYRRECCGELSCGVAVSRWRSSTWWGLVSP